MAEEYRKIKKTILDEIGDAIRLHKQSERKYNPAEFAGIIRKMLVLPSAEALSQIDAVQFTNTADGTLPVVHAAAAISKINRFVLSSTVSGELME